MRWIWIFLIVYLWTSWIGRYSIWFAEGNTVKVDAQDRYNYLQTGGKPAISIIKAMNEAIDMGNVPPEVIVYGLGMEQYRFLANFKLIGALYGWANHKDMMKAVSEGGPKGLFDWLRKYGVNFLAVDDWTVDFSEHDYKMSLPTSDPGWDKYFEKLSVGNQSALYKLKVE